MTGDPRTGASVVMLDGSPLSIGDVAGVANGTALVEVSRDALERVAVSRADLEAAADDGEPHYGVNTGFGSFSRERISASELRSLQTNLIRSHAAGVGDPLPTPIVRGMMLILAASLCRGLSGVRPVVIERLVAMLNAGVTPVVPEVGSVGASGDLAPLAHVGLVLIGEGEAIIRSRSGSAGGTGSVDGSGTVLERDRGAAAMRAAGIEPITLEAKEGLTLINGTHLMASRLSLAWVRFERLVNGACAAAAMSLDGCRATDAFLAPAVYDARNQAGPSLVAARLRALLHGSTILPSHADADDPRVQDPYSIRCAPIVLGAAVDAASHARVAIERELGAVTDNPLVLARRGADTERGTDSGPETEIVSAGNFHGMPLAIPLDVLAIAVTHIAGISERRTYHMISAIDPETRLRPYLSPKPGLHSGYMIAQYTAAACCNELIGLATPSSVANLSTSAGMEDYNSFGPRGAAKLDRAIWLASRVIAIELLCASQAIEAHRPLVSGVGAEAVLGEVRRVVPSLDADRPPSPDIDTIGDMVLRGDVAMGMV
ncbi:MAG: histidine ammonia-lyase [Planctomycetota bacterium]